MNKGKSNGNGNLFRVWVGVLALALFPLTAGAVQWNSGTDFVWNASTGRIDVFPGPGTGNMWAAGTKVPTATGPMYKSPPKALPFNPSPTFQFTSGFTPAAMAKSLMKGGAMAFLAGSAVDVLLDVACVQLAGGQRQLAEGAQWEECRFVTETGLLHRFANMTSTTYDNSWQASKAGHCTSLAALLSVGAGSAGPMSGTVDAIGANNGVAGGGCTIRNKYNEIFQSWSFQSQQNTNTVRDGWKPTTESVAEAALLDKLNAWTQRDFLYGYDPANKDTGDLMDELMAGGRSVESLESAVAPGSQTSIQDPPKTETKVVNGVSTTTTINTTNNYGSTYNSTTNTITVNHTTTTTTTNNTTGETTTTTEEKPPEDLCAKYPDRVGCKLLGTPESAVIPKDTKALTYAAEDLGMGSGSCPAPVSFSTRAGTHNISYQGACNFIETYMKPVALLIGALMALFILMPGKTEA